MLKRSWYICLNMTFYKHIRLNLSSSNSFLVLFMHPFNLDTMRNIITIPWPKSHNITHVMIYCILAIVIQMEKTSIFEQLWYNVKDPSMNAINTSNCNITSVMLCIQTHTLEFFIGILISFLNVILSILILDIRFTPLRAWALFSFTKRHFSFFSSG